MPLPPFSRCPLRGVLRLLAFCCLRCAGPLGRAARGALLSNRVLLGAACRIRSAILRLGPKSAKVWILLNRTRGKLTHHRVHLPEDRHTLDEIPISRLPGESL
jgi:hypothetical protein